MAINYCISYAPLILGFYLPPWKLEFSLGRVCNPSAGNWFGLCSIPLGACLFWGHG